MGHIGMFHSEGYDFQAVFQDTDQLVEDFSLY